MSILESKRIVLKVGSALIAPDNQGCRSHHLLGIAQFIVHCRQRGQQVVLVSSGSVAAGRHWFSGKPASVALKKAMAATGQTDMMALWDKLFDFPSAQILLTHADLCQRERYMSIMETIESLLEHDILPIVNENDTVASKELMVGDNDNLAAMIAAASAADSLIICTDVDGLFNKNPSIHADAVRLETVNQINADIHAMAGDAVSDTGTGGMRTKLEAAVKATAQGIDTYIINGFNQESFMQLLDGNNPGTHFVANRARSSSAVLWMKHTAKAKGEVLIAEADDSVNGEQDITLDSVVAVEGDFAVGDTILVRNVNGTKMAKAKSNYSSCLLNYVLTQGSVRQPTSTDEQPLSIISKDNVAML
ncbi:glutamate 5-kinase [Shewanella sp. NIFS-20-20]|uniref:glutamate 5-kinase n=1 Tax=Shewanella sp. NIFS-20-20 TaxID=2853806 RepID=UPI001C4606D5|nr:glutamate 5-kinase [Shewanella sp. NIFS-20-20]MBV7316820.1 glutamate 5-kinase [Shewanella sp. NIFS-20-20]